MEVIADLAKGAWNVYKSSICCNFVVKPSIPILYFGDLDAYFKSRCKIATVGLNPSREEFPSNDPYYRFPSGQSFLSPPVDKESLESYITALNEYFDHKPYNWFDCYEPILNGMNCSYRKHNQYENVAIHTDICSPIATDPTWSALSDAEQILLRDNGIQLWHNLIKLIHPDIVLISVARKHIERISFSPLSDWQKQKVIERNNPFFLETRIFQVGSSTSTFIFGKAAQTPFGTVSSSDKRDIGKYILCSLGFMK